MRDADDTPLTLDNKDLLSGTTLIPGLGSFFWAGCRPGSIYEVWYTEASTGGLVATLDAGGHTGWLSEVAEKLVWPLLEEASRFQTEQADEADEEAHRKARETPTSLVLPDTVFLEQLGD